MTTLLIILIVLIIAGFSAVLAFLYKQKSKPEDSQNLAMMLQNQLKEVRSTLDSRLSESTKAIQSQFGHSSKIIADVTEKLTKLEETNKQVLNFSEQLQRLQDILRNPKQRGIYGEYSLEMLLQNAFSPKQYKTQYKFKDGAIVDAVIFLGKKILPIDSKFSLENYTRIVDEKDPERRRRLEAAFKQDLKRRIDETAKYIRPDENTLEYALMYIPAEGIYRDLLESEIGAIKVNTRDLIQYAVNEKRVHIVSPTNLYVMLQSIWHGIRDQELQESTQQIVKSLGVLGRHVKAHEDYMKKLGGHLETSSNMYNKAFKEFGKIGKDISKLTDGDLKIDVIQIEGPKEHKVEDVD